MVIANAGFRGNWRLYKLTGVLVSYMVMCGIRGTRSPWKGPKIISVSANLFPRAKQPQSQIPPPQDQPLASTSYSLQQPQKPQQQQQPMYNEMAKSARAVTALTAPPRSNSGESDRSLIQTAYIRSLGQHEGHETTLFYEELGREHSNAAATAANDTSRPFSPRHF